MIEKNWQHHEKKWLEKSQSARCWQFYKMNAKNFTPFSTFSSKDITFVEFLNAFFLWTKILKCLSQIFAHAEEKKGNFPSSAMSTTEICERKIN